MTCAISGLPCPRDPCPGAADPGVCRHLAGLDRLRRGAPPPTLRRAPNRSGVPRVGIVAPCAYRGGAESWMLALVRATRGRLDWQGIAVIAPERAANPGMLAELRAEAPVACGPDAIRALAGRCDVLVSWAMEDHGPWLAGVEPRPRVIYCDHFPHDRPYDDPASAWCLRSADWIVGVSELCAPGFPADFAGRTSVIWHGVDPARVRQLRPRAEVRAGWGVPAGAPVAGYFSRIDRRRAPGAMPRLAAALPPDWYAVIMGDPGPHAGCKADLDAQVAALPAGVRARVRVLPPEPDPGSVLRAFDVLVVAPTPLHESFGLTMAEGIACGVPVVSTPTGIARLVPGLTEVVPFDFDAPALAAAVLRARAAGPPAGPAAEFLRRATPERFGAEWAALVEQLAAPALADGRLHLAVDLCEHGQSGPCGCGPEPRACTRGGVRREVRRDPECYECRRAREA